MHEGERKGEKIERRKKRERIMAEMHEREGKGRIITRIGRVIISWVKWWVIKPTIFL